MRADLGEHAADPVRASARPRSCGGCMISHSSSSSGPGLLMISFGTAILPTSWRSAANSTLRRSAQVEAEPVGDRRARARRRRGCGCRCRRRRPRPRRRAAAPCPGRPRSARAPGRCGPGARARGPRAPRRAASRAGTTAGPTAIAANGGEQADRSERAVERRRPAAIRRRLVPRRDAVDQPPRAAPSRRSRSRTGRQRHDVDRPVVPGEDLGARDDQHQRRADRVPAVAEDVEGAVDAGIARDVVEQAPEQPS